jgi:hypothetical protein
MGKFCSGATSRSSSQPNSISSSISRLPRRARRSRNRSSYVPTRRPITVCFAALHESSCGTPAQGAAVLGFVGASYYFSTVDTRENQAFVKDWEASYKGKPIWQGVSGYVMGQVLDAALKHTGGRLSDKAALHAAIKGVKLTTPAGSFRIQREERADSAALHIAGSRREWRHPAGRAGDHCGVRPGGETAGASARPCAAEVKQSHDRRALSPSWPGLSGLS